MPPNRALNLQNVAKLIPCLRHASDVGALTRAIGDWISFYNTRRPHQALDMKTPAEVFALAA